MIAGVYGSGYVLDLSFPRHQISSAHIKSVKYTDYFVILHRCRLTEQNRIGDYILGRKSLKSLCEIGTSVGVAVGRRSGRQIVTMLVDYYFGISIGVVVAPHSGG